MKLIVLFHIFIFNVGAQLEMPQCTSLFVAPLAHKRYFSIKSKDVNFDTFNAERSTSLAMCDISIPHRAYGASVDMTLFEGGGTGWNGAYYSIHLYSSSTGIVGQADEQVNGLGAGTLEWDYSKGSKLDVTDLYISSGNGLADDDGVCYLVHLSIPAVEDLEPILAFDKAYEIDNGLKGDCSQALQLESPVAIICRNNPSLDVDTRLKILFFASTSNFVSPNLDFGQSKETYAEFRTYLQSNHQVGSTCYIEMDIDDLSVIRPPTPMPSFQPTEIPTNGNNENSTFMTTEDDDLNINVTTPISIIPFGLSHKVRNAIVIFMIIIQIILIIVAVKIVIGTRNINDAANEKDEKDEQGGRSDNRADDDTSVSISVTIPSSNVTHSLRKHISNDEDDEGTDDSNHANNTKNPLHRVFKIGSKNHKRKEDGQRYEMISLDSSSHQLDVSIRGDDYNVNNEDDDAMLEVGKGSYDINDESPENTAEHGEGNM